MRIACPEASARIVTGDTKVMGRGEIDGIVINTTGVALSDVVVRDSGLRAGDRIIVTGTIGDHGLAVMASATRSTWRATCASDVAPINGLVAAAARGGAAATSPR